jgi:sulfite exporter TauE/SafE
LQFNFMKTLLARLQEPSTYAGLAALLGLVGVNLPDAKFQSIAHAVAAIAGALAIFLGESNGPTPPPVAQ